MCVCSVTPCSGRAARTAGCGGKGGGVGEYTAQTQACACTHTHTHHHIHIHTQVFLDQDNNVKLGDMGVAKVGSPCDRRPLCARAMPSCPSSLLVQLPWLQEYMASPQICPPCLGSARTDPEHADKHGQDDCGHVSWVCARLVRVFCAPQGHCPLPVHVAAGMACKSPRSHACLRTAAHHNSLQTAIPP